MRDDGRIMDAPAAARARRGAQAATASVAAADRPLQQQVAGGLVQQQAAGGPVQQQVAAGSPVPQQPRTFWDGPQETA